MSGIPLLAQDRDESHPIVIGGGPCTYNPEPIAEFFDIFYIGEGETVYRNLLDMYKEYKKRDQPPGIPDTGRRSAGNVCAFPLRSFL